jgi:hypothetical protein
MLMTSAAMQVFARIQHEKAPATKTPPGASPWRNKERARANAA